MSEALKELLQYDTPSITNVVATYPGDTELCLGLYDPWESNWYTDQTLRCIYPQMGRRVGYAVTCVIGLPTRDVPRLSFADVLRAVSRSPKPAILLMKQNFPEKYKNKCAMSGGNMTTAMKIAGVVGVISDGPIRDVDELRDMDIQYLTSGVTPGHGDFVVQSINVPVSLAGMDVSPGDIIHMDENGAVKFPPEHLSSVLKRVSRLAEIEKGRMEKMRMADSVETLIEVLSGFEGSK